METNNISVENGRWGEDTAVKSLVGEGYEICERNVRPCTRDKRLEIDVVAYDRKRDTIVFVEIKQHSGKSPFQRRLRSIDKRKMSLLRRACLNWLAASRWKGSYRFDVVEVYGSPSAGVSGIDHIERVRLFAPKGRYVNWND